MITLQGGARLNEQLGRSFFRRNKNIEFQKRPVFGSILVDLARKVANSTVHARTVFLNERKCKCTYGVSLFYTSTPERRVVTHTVKISRPAGPVPIYYGIYAIHPAHKVG